MLPKLYEVSDGGLFLPMYGLMVTAAFCAAFVYIHLRVPKIGIVPDRMLPAYGAAFVGGLLGARVMYVLTTDFSSFLANPLVLFAPSGGGFAVYGGLLGGAAAVLAYLVYARMPLFKLGDIIWPAVILAMGIGRLGCFSAGCCHGAAIHGFEGASLELNGGELLFSTQWPFVAMEFHPVSGSVSRLFDMPLYPTQLWSVIAGVSIAGLLAWLWHRRQFDGQIMALGLLLEPPTRFFVEAFRADHRGYVVTWPASEAWLEWFPGMAQAGDTLLDAGRMGLTSSQFGALLLMVLGAVIYAVQHNRGIAPEEAIEEDDVLLAAD